MAIQVKLFGDLRSKVKEKPIEGALPTRISLDESGIERVSDILSKLSIEESEVSHIFVNGIYSGKNKKVRDGDRVGLFPKRMALLYKWYFPVKDDE
ncbi:MAG: MoaD/ThiS family protein [Promethearchaeota archaeon]